MSDSGNDCDSIEIGSFYFLSVNAWPIGNSAFGLYVKNEDRHGDVSIFGFDDLPGNLDLYLTDRAWSQSTNSFVPNIVEFEGIVTYRTPDEGITAGVTFGMGNNTLVGDTLGDWIDVDVNTTGVDTSQYFSLGEDGDQIFLYCVGSDGRDRPISAFAYGEDFLRPNTETTNNANSKPIVYSYGTQNSSAPDYFFEPSLPNSTMTSFTPGMLEMRPPSECYSQVYWYWEFQVPVCDSCVVNYYHLRNMMGNDANWIGKNPDGTYCRSASPTLVSVSNSGGLVGGLALMLVSWLLF